MRAALLGGIVYFGALFGMGSVLGVARVLYVAPHATPLAALLMEVPLILVIAYVISGWITDFFDVTLAGQCIIMGGTTFILLVAADSLLAHLLGAEASRAVASATDALGPVIGGVAQAIASAFPLVRAELHKVRRNG